MTVWLTDTKAHLLFDGAVIIFREIVSFSALYREECKKNLDPPSNRFHDSTFCDDMRKEAEYLSGFPNYVHYSFRPCTFSYDRQYLGFEEVRRALNIFTNHFVKVMENP